MRGETGRMAFCDTLSGRPQGRAAGAPVEADADVDA